MQKEDERSTKERRIAVFNAIFAIALNIQRIDLL